VPLLRDILYLLAVLVTAPVWLIALIRTGKWRTDWPGRFGRVPPGARPAASEAPRPKRLLIHGVSVGEVNAVRGLVDALGQLDPPVDVVISTTTNTGTARAKALYGDRHAVVRFPFDFSWCVRRFLKAVEPDAVALVELELWPNFLAACRSRGIRACVVNGRISERSFRGYRRLRPVLRGMFASLTAAGVQTQDYADRFAAMGTPPDRVRVLDTMKWDNAVITDTVDGAADLAEELGLDPDRPVIVAGSTAPGEDELLIGQRPPEAQLIIAPRKPEWFDAVTRHAPHAVRRTTRIPGPADVYLLDTIGELKKAYALADVVVVGRSFVPLYGSDVMEPVGLGRPTIIGPHHSDFAEMVAALESAGGLVVAGDVGDAMRELLRNRRLAAEIAAAGRAVIRERQGATARHVAMLREVMGLGAHT